jgi:rhomboid family protein
MGLFDKDKYSNHRYSRPSMFGGFAFFPPVIKYLLISNVLIFLFDNIFFRGFRIGNIPLNLWFEHYFALFPIGSGFYPWQLFTYMFMHADFLHLFFNMFALWMFGMELENLWGPKKFLGYYLLCGVCAGISHLVFSPLFTVPGPTIGASGSIYGVLIAFGLIFPDRPIFLYFLFPIKAKYFIMLYMIIELISIGNADGVAHFAHLGGAVAGFFYLMISQYTQVTSRFSNIFSELKKPKRKQEDTSIPYTRHRYYDKFSNVSDADYYSEKDEDSNEVSQERIDEILDKISREGYKNLTEEEKRILFEASKKIH